MKSFASNLVHKYGFGVLLMLVALVLLPQVYITILSYLHFGCMLIAFATTLSGSEIGVLVAQGLSMLCTGALALSLLIDHWDWSWVPS